MPQLPNNENETDKAVAEFFKIISSRIVNREKVVCATNILTLVGSLYIGYGLDMYLSVDPDEQFIGATSMFLGFILTLLKK